MAISLNVNAKQDYSYLFRNMGGSGNGLGNLNFLSDYASIKNGSYGKLMRAYYTKDTDVSSKKEAGKTDEKINSISTSSDSAKVLSGIEKAADGLKESADAMLKKGKDSLFAEGKEDQVFGAVKNFADNYNKLVDQLSDANAKSLQNRFTSLTNFTMANTKKLAEVGITVNQDKTLTVNEEAFKKADSDKIKNLFGTTGSYGYQISAQASLTDYAAEKESTRANTYTQFGAYSNNYSVGNMLNMMF